MNGKNVQRIIEPEFPFDKNYAVVADYGNGNTYRDTRHRRYETGCRSNSYQPGHSPGDGAQQARAMVNPADYHPGESCRCG